MQTTRRKARGTIPREILASVTERGQVTIPAEVREALGISKGGKVIFRVEDGEVVVKKPPYSSIAEMVADAPKINIKEPMTWREIQEIVDEEKAEAYLQKMREGRA